MKNHGINGWFMTAIPSRISFAALFLLVILGLLGNVTLYGQKKAKVKVPKKSDTTAFKTNSGPPSAVVCKGKNALDAAAVADILAAHNRIRDELKLPALVWNCDLAEMAQEWATRGIVEHRPDLDVGESIFIAGDPNVTPANAVARWMGEKQSWDNVKGICEAGKFCTHYTQIVWRRTKKIGCGINRNVTGKWKVMLVCNYDPAGNETAGPAY